MNISILFLVLAMLLVATLLATWAKGFRRTPPLMKFAYWLNRAGELLLPCQGAYALANIAEGEHLNGKITYTADNAFASRFLLAKRGSDDAHIDICGAADQPSGVCTDAPAAGDVASIDVLGAAPGTHRCVLATQVTAVDQALYTAAAGQVQTEPGVAGTYWHVGYAKMIGAIGDTIEFSAIAPTKLVVVAALTAPGTAAAVDLATAEALANACKADLTALHTALATPARLKFL